MDDNTDYCPHGVPLGNDLLDATRLFLSKVDSKYKRPRIELVMFGLDNYQTIEFMDIFGMLMS
jgi:hypothetical protein